MINVTIVGFGNVGTSLALLLLNNKHPLRLNIMDPNEQREGAILDLAHGMPLYSKKELYINNEKLFLNADFIFFAAGTPSLFGHSRLSKAKENTQLSKEIFKNRDFLKKPFIIVITNPVDIVSYSVYQCSGLSSQQVIGTGTFLDSLRLAYYLSCISKYNAEDFEAFVLGEHGSSQVAAFSMTRLKEQPILSSSEFRLKDLQLAQKHTREAANQIRKTQTGTTYGVSKCAEMIMDFLLSSDEHLLTLSMLTNEHYRSLLNLDHDIYISMPVIIKNGNIEIHNDIRLSDKEYDAYRKSAAILADIIQ